MPPERQAPSRRKDPWRACIPSVGRPSLPVAPAAFVSLETTRSPVASSSYYFLLAPWRQFSTESGQEGDTLGIAQRHHQTVQDIRWGGEHLWRHALSRHIEVDDCDLQASNAPGRLREHSCLPAVGALVTDIDL